MAYVLLSIAIVAEVIATSVMKLSDGFTKPVPTLITAVGYGIAFFLLAQVLKTLPTGIAYAIWSGAGIVLIAAVAWIFQGQKLDAPALIGIGLIIAGILVMNLFSATGSH